MNIPRREWLRLAAMAGTGLLPMACQRTRENPPSTDTDGPLARFPGKTAMRLVNDRPPCLETPWRYFRHDLTPMEAFYVRWHLQALPLDVDIKTWRLQVDGAVDRSLELSMDDLRKLGDDEVVAVNQCSGNSRGLFNPRVPVRNGRMEPWATLAGLESHLQRYSGRPASEKTPSR